MTVIEQARPGRRTGLHILAQALLAALTLLVAVSSAAAQTAWTAPPGTKGWGTFSNFQEDGPVTTIYFSSPGEACYYQYKLAAQKWPNSIGPFGGYNNTNYWYSKKCRWTTQISAAGPAGTGFACESTFQAVAPGTCTKKVLPLACASTPHPINILSGEKSFSAEDFSPVDHQSIGLRRTYTSMPFAGTPGADQSAGMPAGLANWAYDFGYELQINWDAIGDWTVNRAVELISPRGQSLRFVKPSSGGIMLPAASKLSTHQDNVALTFTGTWPSDLNALVSSKTTWTMRDRDDNQWFLETSASPVDGHFSIARPVRRVTRTGVETTFQYGSHGELVSIKNNLGTIVVSFTWLTDPDGSLPTAISKATLADGSRVEYSYDTIDPTSTAHEPDRLSGVKYYDANSVLVDTTKYSYDSSKPFALDRIKDSNNVVRWDVDYDDFGRATSSTGPLGVDSYTVSYAEGYGDFASTTVTAQGITDLTSNGNLISRTVTNPLGKISSYQFIGDAPGGDMHEPVLVRLDGQPTTSCAEADESLVYDTSLRLQSSQAAVQGSLGATTTVAASRKTSYVRDSRGRPTTIVEADGAAEARTTTITWHPSLNVPTQVKVGGTSSTDYAYVNGRLTTRTVTDLTTYVAPYATNGRTRTWTYGWGTSGASTGKVTSVDGPLAGTADTVAFGYDAATGYLNSITNELGQATQYTVLDARGAPLTILDPNGVSTNLTYDVHGRVLSAKINPGTSQSVYQFSYDAVGNLTRITLPLGGFLQYTYDTGSRLTLVTNDRGETVTVTQNQMKQTTGVTTRQGGAIYYQQQYAYDELGRLVSSIGGGQQAAAYGYDEADRQTSLTDPRHKLFTTAFDKLDRVVSTTKPGSETVQYGYDAQDQLTGHTDGRGLQTSRMVNGFGQVIQETSPDRGVRKYWYSDAGKLTKIVDGDNETTEFTYDNAGRLTGETHATATAENVGYTYDQTAGGNKGVGRLTRVNDQSGQTKYTYDAQGRVVTVLKTIQSQAYTIQYAYDANGKVIAMTLPSGRIVNITRAIDGLASDITTKASAAAPAQNLASSIVYNPMGPVRSLTFGNGLALTRSYDLNYWLGRIQVMAGASPKLDLSFTRNGDGQVTAVTDNVAATRNAAFTYTNAGRLLTASGSWGDDTYAYDLAGNRTSKTRVAGGGTAVETAILSGSNNRIGTIQNGSGSVIRTLSYRAGGDVSQDAATGSPAVQYVYNLRKRLVGVQAGSTVYGQYGYDYLGQRVWRTVGSGASAVTTHAIYDPDGHLLAEQDGATGAAIREYVWLDDMPVAVIDRSSGTAQVEYIHTGQLEEPLILTDANQTKIWEGFSEPYGSTLVTGSATLNLRLPGQQLQSETGGLHQNRFRDYDPSLGRYVEADPLGFEAGQNVYGYVDGRPTEWTDKTGQCPWCVVGAVAGGGLNLLWQLSQHDWNIHCVNWWQVGEFALLGALLGDLVPLASGAGEVAATIDASVGVGDYAGESIAARSASRSFTTAERAEINRIGSETGCHTCGTKNPGTESGNFVPDHQPPSSMNPSEQPQRLYPQCLSCSRQQGLNIAKILRGVIQ